MEPPRILEVDRVVHQFLCAANSPRLCRLLVSWNRYKPETRLEFKWSVQHVTDRKKRGIAKATDRTVSIFEPYQSRVARVLEFDFPKVAYADNFQMIDVFSRFGPERVRLFRRSLTTALSEHLPFFGLGI